MSNDLTEEFKAKRLKLLKDVGRRLKKLEIKSRVDNREAREDIEVFDPYEEIGYKGDNLSPEYREENY